MVDARRPGVAFSLGGMGSASTNFYNQAYARQGFADVAREAQARWVDGDRAGAAALIPDELVLGTTLIGTEQMVRDRLALWDQVGVTTARLYPAGDTLDAAPRHAGPRAWNDSRHALTPERGDEPGDVVGRDPAAAADDPRPLVDPRRGSSLTRSSTSISTKRQFGISKYPLSG